MQLIDQLLKRPYLRLDLAFRVFRQANALRIAHCTFHATRHLCFPRQYRWFTVRPHDHEFVTRQRQSVHEFLHLPKMNHSFARNCSCRNTSVFLSFPDQQRHAIFLHHEAIVKPDHSQRVVLIASHDVHEKRAATCHASTAPSSERFVRHAVRWNLIRARLIAAHLIHPPLSSYSNGINQTDFRIELSGHLECPILCAQLCSHRCHQLYGRSTVA